MKYRPNQSLSQSLEIGGIEMEVKKKIKSNFNIKITDLENNKSISASYYIENGSKEKVQEKIEKALGC